MMAVIAQAARDPTCDVSKMSALLEMAERMERHAAEVEFNAALARLMPRLPRVEKNGAIYGKDGKLRSTYAKYEDISLVIRPLLAEEGMAISFDTDDSNPKYVKVIGTLSHRMGFSRQGHCTVPIENPVISGCQAVGSAISYGKRYVTVNLLDIVTVGADTDGQADPQVIGAEQVLNIETMLQDTKADRAKFYAWVGVSKVEEILERDYNKVLKMLEAKRRGQ
jgi:hypothetical protein